MKTPTRILIALSIIGCTKGSQPSIAQQTQTNTSTAVAVAAIFGACLAVMSGGGSSPFLYFQF